MSVKPLAMRPDRRCLRTSWPWPSDCWRNRNRIKISCTACTPRRWSVSARGKCINGMNSGVKASIATTNKSNFVVGGLALPGSPYDGHTLTKALAQVRRLTGEAIDEAFVDKGYRGHDETEATVYISGQKRGIKTQRLKRSLKRRQAIEPVIGHLKSDGLLNRNHLKGTEGDQLNVLLSCAGHNLRLILRQLRFFCLEKRTRILAWLRLLGACRASVRRRHTVEPKAGWSGSATDAHNGSLKPGFSGSTSYVILPKNPWS